MEQRWYAVLRDNNDNDWGTGSHTFAEARVLCEEWLVDNPEAYIAVIIESDNPVCEDEVHRDENGYWRGDSGEWYE